MERKSYTLKPFKKCWCVTDSVLFLIDSCYQTFLLYFHREQTESGVWKVVKEKRWEKQIVSDNLSNWDNWLEWSLSNDPLQFKNSCLKCDFFHCFTGRRWFPRDKGWHGHQRRQGDNSVWSWAFVLLFYRRYQIFGEPLNWLFTVGRQWSSRSTWRRWTWGSKGSNRIFGRSRSSRNSWREGISLRIIDVYNCNTRQ